VRRILDPLRDGRTAEALDAALARWREQPVSDLADVVRRLDRLVPAEPGSVGEAIRGALARGMDQTRERVDALCATFAPDPRVTDHLLSYFDQPPFNLTLASASAHALTKALAGHLVASPDPRIDPWLVDLGAYLRARAGARKGQYGPEEIALVEQVFGGLVRAPAGVPPLSPAEQALLERIRAELDALERVAFADEALGRELLAAVAARLDDDGPKQVYADWLIERGDEMGEFVRLSVREPDLDATEQRRLGGLKTRMRKRYAMIPGRLEFERGFPVRTFCADKYGARHGRYGLEPEWATVRATDLVPTSDDCHTENLVELHVGTSHVVDLARLRRPLGVRDLVMTSFSRSGGAAWRKVTTLPELTRLTLDAGAIDPDDVVWFLNDIPTGRTVREVAARWPVAHRVPEWFAKCPSLQRVLLGDHVVIERDGEHSPPDRSADPPQGHEPRELGFALRSGGASTHRQRRDYLRASFELDSAAAVREARQLLAGVTEPIVRVAVIRSALPLEDHAPLHKIAERIETEAAPSPVAARASTRRRDDRLTIEPAAGDVLDEVSLHGILSAQHPLPPARHVIVDGSVDLGRLGRMVAAARANGAGVLEVGHPVTRRDLRGWFRLAIGGEEVRAELGTANAAILLELALGGLGRCERLVVGLASGLTPMDEQMISARIGPHAASVAVERLPEVRGFTTRLVKTKRRLEVRAADGFRSGALAPATLDALVEAEDGEVETVEVETRPDPRSLASWVRWVAERQVAVAFGKQRPDLELAWTGTGVAARLRLPPVASLDEVPPGALERLALVTRAAVDPAVEASARRAAVEVVVEGDARG
jgi:uncharacterized protein (TIGR02996 family)